MTFSKSLADHIVGQKGSDYKVERRSFKTANSLRLGEESRSGAYAILSKRSGKVLRVTLIRELAELLCDDSRYLKEFWLV